MKSFGILHLLFVCLFDLPVVKAGCGVSSVYSFLSTYSTGSDFCSTYLYPDGPTPIATSTESYTYTNPCSTRTVRVTTSTTTTVVKTKSKTLPTLNYYQYSSTVLVPSGTHRTVNKRQAANSTASISPTSTITSGNAAASPAAVSADAKSSSCSPTPNKLCSCPSSSISAACSSLVTSPPGYTYVEYSGTTVDCTTKDTYTTTRAIASVTTTYTMTFYPPPNLISETGVLTTTVPAGCAGTAYTNKGQIPDGAEIHFADYPDQPQDRVDCCLACYQSNRYPNCIASAWIEGSYSCELLIQVNATTNGKTSAQCPLGVVNYEFNPKANGNIYPGPCGY